MLRACRPAAVLVVAEVVVAAVAVATRLCSTPCVPYSSITHAVKIFHNFVHISARILLVLVGEHRPILYNPQINVQKRYERGCYVSCFIRVRSCCCCSVPCARTFDACKRENITVRHAMGCGGGGNGGGGGGCGGGTTAAAAAAADGCIDF